MSKADSPLAKRPKVEEARKSEKDVGITEYVSNTPPIFGILKLRHE